MANLATSKPGYYGKGSVIVAEPARQGEGPIRRFAPTADRLITQPKEGVDTVYDVLTTAVAAHGDRDALGYRDVLKIHEEEKEVTKVIGGKETKEIKKWKYFELSEYKFLSYKQVFSAVSEVARGLVDLGIGKDDIFNVYSQTCVNWQLMAHACSSISTTIATAYDSLGEEGLTHSLNEPGCVGIFTNADLLPTVLRVLPNTPTVRVIVYDEKPSGDLLEKLRGVREGVTVMSIEELREHGKGKSEETLDGRRPTKETMACIMYTSGSTGAPKGVCLTHSNLVASVGAVYVHLGHHLTQEDRFLAYLPLAHILEYIVEMTMFYVGMPSGYGRVKTLTDASVRNCQGDMTAFRPSIMIGVPTVWETIRKGILAKVNKSGTIKKSMFNGAMAAKKNNLPGLSQLADSVVLKGVKEATGGRLRVALSGASSLSKETQEFLNVALVTLLQGYGMTESCGMCAILPPELMQYSVVGIPVPSIEIKMLDVPDAGYDANGDPPQGEICIRGPSVTKGYYKRPDLNEDPSVFTEDGWFRTGDVGRWNKDGTLSIVDRIKNLVKLQNGEYIALERLESAYKACNLVSNICVHGSSDLKQPLAIVIPNEAHLRHTLEAQNSAEAKADLHALCESAKVRALVMKECNAVGKKNGFKPMELLQAVVLTPEEWTPESGLVTAAQKIQRSKIGKTFEKEIKEITEGQR
ncbi:hypothetical protein BD626DRAFT_495427 [Schizophyllum amplum]|uniref:AMP-dependent synthetase/ligase domain-containing protein n=1 Tax=Schizophyllum amplum TaxID=97359 RepID=A0A550CE56_9AGAR|nr:hypothetical protein BD626DRAFT_495427 [Auriculariopsis ampla]